MVCVSLPGYDVASDGVKIVENDGVISAEGTTLGADNGIGVALAMAATHIQDRPTLELVFTVDEERGMSGAKAIDLSRLQSKRLINLDEEDISSLCIASAGGQDLSINVPLEVLDVAGEGCEVSIS